MVLGATGAGADVLGLDVGRDDPVVDPRRVRWPRRAQLASARVEPERRGVRPVRALRRRGGGREDRAGGGARGCGGGESKGADGGPESVRVQAGRVSPVAAASCVSAAAAAAAAAAEPRRRRRRCRRRVRRGRRVRHERDEGGDGGRTRRRRRRRRKKSGGSRLTRSRSVPRRCWWRGRARRVSRRAEPSRTRYGPPRTPRTWRSFPPANPPNASTTNENNNDSNSNNDGNSNNDDNDNKNNTVVAPASLEFAVDPSELAGATGATVLVSVRDVADPDPSPNPGLRLERVRARARVERDHPPRAGVASHVVPASSLARQFRSPRSGRFASSP